jgi:uncharacterized caspase-like protein
VFNAIALGRYYSANKPPLLSIRLPSPVALPSATAKIYESAVIHPALLDGNPTALKIRDTLDDLGRAMRPDDVFVLYLSGHGFTDDGHYYFLPHDASYDNDDDDALVKSSVSQDQLQESLTQIPALRSVLIFDRCESGSMAEDRSRARGLQRLVAVEKLSRSTSRTVLTATNDVVAAREGCHDHGVFTYVLLDAFASADLNNDGRIDTAELAEYLRAKLPDLSEKQMKFRQEPQAKLTSAPFVLINRTDVSQINKLL